jgi:hypothetical protein
VSWQNHQGVEEGAMPAWQPVALEASPRVLSALAAASTRDARARTAAAGVQAKVRAGLVASGSPRNAPRKPAAAEAGRRGAEGRELKKRQASKPNSSSAARAAGRRAGYVVRAPPRAAHSPPSPKSPLSPGDDNRRGRRHAEVSATRQLLAPWATADASGAR